MNQIFSLKRIVFYAIGMVVLFLSLGCSDDEGRKLVAEYLNNDILRIYELEETALKHYAGVTGKNYTNDQTLYETLKSKVIPPHSRFVHLLEQIDSPNDDIGKLQRIYVQSAREFQTGFALLLSAVEKKDPALTQLANIHIAEGRQKGAQWRKEFFSVCEKNGLKVIYKEAGGDRVLETKKK